MAEAGLKAPAKGDFIFIHWDQIAMLIEHQRAAEREECAKVCEELADKLLEGNWSAAQSHQAAGAEDCAAAIRARGTK